MFDLNTMMVRDVLHAFEDGARLPDHRGTPYSTCRVLPTLLPTP